MQTGIDPSIYYHRGMHWYEDAATLQCMRRHLIHNPLAQRHDLVFAKISVHARNQSQTALYWMSGSLHVTYAYKKDNFLTTRVYKLISYVVYILILEGGGKPEMFLLHILLIRFKNLSRGSTTWAQEAVISYPFSYPPTVQLMQIQVKSFRMQGEKKNSDHSDFDRGI